MEVITTPDASDLQQIVSAKSLSANARIVALAMQMHPEMSVRQLAELTGISRSTVHRALSQVSHWRDSEGVPSVPSVPPAGQEVSQVSHQRDSERPKCPASGTAAKEKTPHTPQKENNIYIPITAGALGEELRGLSQQQAGSTDDEISGLNGSTTECIDTVAGWLHRSAEPGAARAIVADYCQAYGAEKFKIGLLELRQAKRAGRIVDPIASLGQFCKNARLPNEPGALGKARADDRHARSHFESAGQKIPLDHWGQQAVAQHEALLAEVDRMGAEAVQ